MTDRPTWVGPYLVPAGVMVFPCLYTLFNYSGNWADDPTEVQAGAQKAACRGGPRWNPCVQPARVAGRARLALQSAHIGCRVCTQGRGWVCAWLARQQRACKFTGGTAQSVVSGYVRG
jgi:hypothetical protein